MPLKRTWTKNIRPIIVRDEFAIVPLSGDQFALIDAADVPLVEGWNWTAIKDGNCWYAARGGSIGGGKSASIRMHQVILGITDGRLPDHRDGNGLNNRRSNLRPATRKQNNQNRRIGSGNKSGFKGVCFRSDRNTWLASIRLDGKLKKLGTFSTKEAAASAYDAAAKDAFGEFAFLNFPDKFAEAAE